MATLDNGQPRVRMMGLWFANENGFYFQAWTFKDIYQQLKENPGVEICFHSQDKEDPYSMMRLRGKVEFVEEPALREQILKDRPFLKDLGAEGPDDPRIVIFRVAHGEAFFWPVKKEGEYPGSDKLKF